MRSESGDNGPFGIAMNKPLPTNLDAEQSEPNFYVIENPPKAHPDFESVVVISFPEIGVCSIKGIGRNIDNDGAGALIRSKIDALTASLETKYGSSEKVDICVGGDIQCADNYWMMILNSGERAYASQWKKQNDEMRRLGIGSIVAIAETTDIQTSYPVLEFNSAKANECESAQNNAGAEAL